MRGLVCKMCLWSSHSWAYQEVRTRDIRKEAMTDSQAKSLHKCIALSQPVHIFLKAGFCIIGLCQGNEKVLTRVTRCTFLGRFTRDGSPSAVWVAKFLSVCSSVAVAVRLTQALVPNLKSGTRQSELKRERYLKFTLPLRPVNHPYPSLPPLHLWGLSNWKFYKGVKGDAEKNTTTLRAQSKYLLCWKTS